MEAFLPDTVKTILLVLIATAIVLVWLARTFPQVTWLRIFRLPAFQLSEEQKRRRQRSGNRQAALEIIVAGLALPVVYFVSTLLLFNQPKTIPTLLVTACSVLCIAIGVWIFSRNR
jgi:hypothetical protein